MNRIPSSSDRRQGAFTLMEILVVVAIIIVLAAIGVPAYMMVRQNSYKSVAINKLQQLGAAFVRFSNEQNGALPLEDASGKDDWAPAQDPKNDRVWYNALPKLAGVRNVKDYASEPEAFYRNDNLLYLPGAKYPPVDKAIAQPIFALAMNSRLQRRETAEPAPAIGKAGSAPGEYPEARANGGFSRVWYQRREESGRGPTGVQRKSQGQRRALSWRVTTIPASSVSWTGTSTPSVGRTSLIIPAT